MIGIIVALIFAAIGYGIATIKIPETNNFDITRKAGGEKLDEVMEGYKKILKTSGEKELEHK